MSSVDPIEALRRSLVERLTSRPDTAWTVTPGRLVVRCGGRLLCKVGRDAEHVLVEFPLPAGEPGVIDAAPFVGPAAPGEADPVRWRQARPSTAEELESLLGWLLPERRES